MYVCMFVKTVTVYKLLFIFNLYIALHWANQFYQKLIVKAYAVRTSLYISLFCNKCISAFFKKYKKIC